MNGIEERQHLAIASAYRRAPASKVWPRSAARRVQDSDAAVGGDGQHALAHALQHVAVRQGVLRHSRTVPEREDLRPFVLYRPAPRSARGPTSICQVSSVVPSAWSSDVRAFR